MNGTKRNIGQEILEGLREIKRGKQGRVVEIPDIRKRSRKRSRNQKG